MLTQCRLLAVLPCKFSTQLPKLFYYNCLLFGYFYFSGTLMLQYAIMLEDLAMYRVNLAAILLNVGYIAIYYLYCSEKWHQIFKPSAFGVLLIAVLLGYIGYEDPELIENRYSFIVTILMLGLIGSPLLEVVSKHMLCLMDSCWKILMIVIYRIITA